MYETTYTYQTYTPELHQELDIPHPYLSSDEIAESLKSNQESASEVNMTSLNFPLFFFWHRIRAMNEHSQYNTIISGLLGSMLQDKLLESNIILSAVLILGGLNTFEMAKSRILDSLSVDEDKKAEIYNNPLYGIGNANGLLKWWNVINSSKSQSVSRLIPIICTSKFQHTQILQHNTPTQIIIHACFSYCIYRN